VRRRDFIACASALSVIGGNVFAEAGDKLPVVGILTPLESGDPYDEALVEGLRDEGYIDGQTVHILARYAGGDFARLPALAAELAQANPDVIVTSTTPAVLAAESATHTIPIVMASVGDPIALGVAKTLAHPGGNATGITLLSEDLNAKRLALVKEALPGASRVALLTNPDNPAMRHIAAREIPTTAQTLGLATRTFEAARYEAFDTVLAAATAWKAEAVLALDDVLFDERAASLAEAALRHALPVIGSVPRQASAGFLFTYGIDIGANYRRAAELVAKILKGERPGDIPIENPRRFTMIVNLKAAKQLGIDLPTATLLRADRVIE
jgi:putative tryptophan/tyrosine transport system substrate-binding protein